MDLADLYERKRNSFCASASHVVFTMTCSPPLHLPLQPPRQLREFNDILRGAVEEKPVDGLHARVYFFCGARGTRGEAWDVAGAPCLIGQLLVSVAPARPPSSGAMRCDKDQPAP